MTDEVLVSWRDMAKAVIASGANTYPDIIMAHYIVELVDEIQRLRSQLTKLTEVIT